jgi:SAM-dependent methyltransferase
MMTSLRIRPWAEPHQPGRFAAGWLTLRERLDCLARNRRLAVTLAQRLPRRPVILDLGAGTGSLFRYLAPIIARPQRWIFADADRSLIEAAFDRTLDWARERGFTARRSRKSRMPALSIATSWGIWRIDALAIDLAMAPRGLPLDEVDAVTCSALLDLASRHWMERLFAALRTPFYASLTVNGRDAWFPPHPADATVRLAFRRDQRREKGLGLALGVEATRTAVELLATLGFDTLAADSDWRIVRGERSLGRLLAGMTAGAASHAVPARAGTIGSWYRARLDDAGRARLAIRIGHRDILGFPPPDRAHAKAARITTR